MRNPGLPTVAVLGAFSLDEWPSREQLRSHPAPDYEADSFHLSRFLTDHNLNRILNELDPQVIVSIGNLEDFPNLLAAPHYVRRRWIHKETASELCGSDIMACFLGATLDTSPVRKVSVYTPVFNTGRERLLRTWNSLQRQSYNDWEWVICDDHSDDPGTLEVLAEIQDDYRVSVHRLAKPSGNIGELKGFLCSVASGDVFLELDHDDVLTADAVGWVVDAFDKHPECGFAYTNWAEQYEGSLEAHDYGDYYAFGYGRSHWEGPYLVQDAPPINAQTIRHIVGVPNHIRAWTRNAYHEAGGYSGLHVADDYELLVRTFLTTQLIHIPRLGYIQFYNPDSIGNTQHSRNKEIQRIVRFVAAHYEPRIHARLLELGFGDSI